MIRTSLATVVIGGLLFAAAPARAELPAWKEVEQLVAEQFKSRKDYRQGDLITRDDGTAVLQQLAGAGWKVTDARTIAADMLPAGHVLVATVRSREGRRWMRKIASQPLVYDRLDRISRESGGRRLIQDLARLPDGERYVATKRHAAVPGLEELLPKDRSGKIRRVKDYDKPTGSIYTQQQLLDRLQASYKAAASPRGKAATPRRGN